MVNKLAFFIELLTVTLLSVTLNPAVSQWVTEREKLGTDPYVTIATKFNYEIAKKCPPKNLCTHGARHGSRFILEHRITEITKEKAECNC